MQASRAAFIGHLPFLSRRTCAGERGQRVEELLGELRGELVFLINHIAPKTTATVVRSL
jgi:hypothetical protein